MVARRAVPAADRFVELSLAWYCMETSIQLPWFHFELESTEVDPLKHDSREKEKNREMVEGAKKAVDMAASSYLPGGPPSIPFVFFFRIFSKISLSLSSLEQDTRVLCLSFFFSEEPFEHSPQLPVVLTNKYLIPIIK